MNTPTKEEFHRGCQEYEQHEKRDAMYKVATFLVAYAWGKPADMAEGLGVLLLTWNQAFYRYGLLDFDKLEHCIAEHFQDIEALRNRNILSLTRDDEVVIRRLFVAFLDALQISDGSMRGRKSPVGTAKALHLLAPSFFPLWDNKIARAYGCYYIQRPADQYIAFCAKMRDLAATVQEAPRDSGRPLAKLIDEYNYAKYTKRWL